MSVAEKSRAARRYGRPARPQPPHERAEAMTNTVTDPTPDGWAVLAAELTAIATDLAALAGSGVPVPSYVDLTLILGDRGGDESVVAGVDTIGRALLDKPGQVSKMSNGTYHYDARGRRGPVRVSLLNGISTAFAKQRQRGAEMARVREQLAAAEAEAARLRAELAKHAGYAPAGRTTAVAEAKPDTYGRALGHHGPTS